MAIDIIAIVVRTLGLAAMLQAVGIFVFTALFGSQVPALTAELRATVRWMAVAGAVLVLIHQLLQAGRMTGSMDGILDASLQRDALLSHAGLANAMRMAGLLAIIAAAGVSGSRILGLCGGLLVAASFTATGHTSAHPLRVVLAPLLALHLWILAFWFGALWPLFRVTALAPAAASAVVNRFSRLATVMVPAVAVAGLLMAVAILPTWRSVGTAYGLLLCAKVLGFVVLMGLAALNKLRLAPALGRGSLAGRRALRCSLVAEGLLIAIVLAITAAMTAMFSPT
jgi:putative copper export protein